jgi:hypothetical protein
MAEISGIHPQFSATRDGGETVEISGLGLDAVTSVTFGPFEGEVLNRTEAQLTVRAPGYRPGWGDGHGEVIAWVDTEPAHSGVIWTWAGHSLGELGGPLDDIDTAVALGSVPAPTAHPGDAVDEVLKPAESGAGGAAPQHAVVEGFAPTDVPRRTGGWITLHGRGFTGATQVTIGDHPCAQFEVRSDTELVVLVPPYRYVESALPSSPFVWHGQEMSLVDSRLPVFRWRVDEDTTMTFATETPAEPPT